LHHSGHQGGDDQLNYDEALNISKCFPEEPKELGDVARELQEEMQLDSQRKQHKCV